MANSLNIEQIKDILPHRHPFLLIDRIEDYEPGQFAIGTKCVSFNEPFFAGHFPQMAIMPGVLIVEALAQTGAVAILCKEENKGKIAVFTGIDNCKFKKPVVPGEVLTLETRITQVRGPVGVGEAKATANGELKCSCTIKFAIIDN